MVYYGAVEKSADNIQQIYTFLQEALMISPQNLPLRGPRNFKRRNWEYRNNWQGNMENYSGKENIYQHEIGVYWAKYLGGLINQRSE